MKICFFFWFCLLGFWIPAGAAPMPTVTGERVLDAFEIGSGVVVRALTVERSTGTLWVGTSVGALEIDLDTQALRNTYSRQNGLASEYVFGIGIDNKGYKWFGTNSGGAARMKDGKWKTYFPMHGLADYWVYGFANDRQGNLWIATRAGVNRFSARTGKFENYSRNLVDKWVYGVAVDDDGKVWFGTHGGVSMFDGVRWFSWTHKDGVGAPNASNVDVKQESQGASSYNPDYVLSVFPAPDKSIWVGTLGGGVSRYDGAVWSSLTTADGLAGNIVYAILRDSKGVFWFGTDNGLSRYDGMLWKTFSLHAGLLDKNVYALALAPNGDIWAGTGKGVVRIGFDQSKR